MIDIRMYYGRKSLLKTFKKKTKNYYHQVKEYIYIYNFLMKNKLNLQMLD
jgi:hypothetical protein